MKKDYIVFSQTLAGYLMMRKFVLKRLDKSNKPNSIKNIFIFNESDELLAAIEEFKKQYHK
ncbi:DUF5659 domain-containing protein [Bacillus sp. FJAT-22090]|uniref:DUF5659 domain-containing protein n=1 Tax=Bacillus sp. FJAT-22090 TaxID=1581038 RepID=UPI0011A43757|nr:DUF5659 domain-containing protein [Bacillus sp. FJAT-22090]